MQLVTYNHSAYRRWLGSRRDSEELDRLGEQKVADRALRYHGCPFSLLPGQDGELPRPHWTRRLLPDSGALHAMGLHGVKQLGPVWNQSVLSCCNLLLV